MLIYEVNLVIDEPVYQDYLDWLLPHVKEMVSFDGFIDAKLYKNTEDACALVVCYRVESQQHLEHYYNTYAKHL